MKPYQLDLFMDYFLLSEPSSVINEAIKILASSSLVEFLTNDVKIISINMNKLTIKLFITCTQYFLFLKDV